MLTSPHIKISAIVKALMVILFVNPSGYNNSNIVWAQSS